MIRSWTSLALLSLTALATAQLDPPKPAPLVGARSLALSPDGKRLAFSYQGDIWVADSAGGKAVPLTNHIELDDTPVWSPDGEWIAFSSNRNGNNDIYVVPADGGETKRLTWNSGPDVPSDWSPDGKYILEKATRDNPANGFYLIDVKTGAFKQVMLDMMPVGSPRFSPDGKSIVYNRFGFPWVRSRYEGSAAAQLWSYDIASGKRTKIRANRFQHLWPNPSPDGKAVLAVTVGDKTPSSSYAGKPIPKFVDNAKRTPNVWSVNMSGDAKQLTDFVGAPCDFLTVARTAGNAAFEEDGDVYVMAPGKRAAKITLTASIDDKTTQEEHLVLTDGARDASLSPKGDKMVFEVRGELWMVPTKKGKGPNADDAVQLTDWAGTDAQPFWNPDNKNLYFVSDRDGAERLYSMDTDTKAVTPVSKLNADVGSLRLTPDKTKLSYWQSGKDGGLYTVPVSGGTPTKLLTRSGGTQFYSWSPDGRYVAYSEPLLRSGYYLWEQGTNIYVFDTETQKSTNLTKLNVQNLNPTWSPDGKYLFFRSDRTGPGLYAIPLHQEDARPTELDLKYEKPTGPVKVDIDTFNIDDRPRRISEKSPESQVLVDPSNGDLIFVSAGDVWKTKYNGEDPTQMTRTGGIRDIEFNADSTKLQLIRSGIPAILALHEREYPVTAVTFRADWNHDLRKEHLAAYNEFWRRYNQGFYDGNFHARDWEMLGARYRKFLPSVGHRNEMATILNQLVGQLESSHSEVSPAPSPVASTTSPHIGFLIDYSYSGPGIKVKEVPAHTIGSFAKTKLVPGEIVTKINGHDISANEALYRDILNDQIGRELTYTVQGADGKTRDLKFRAISSGEFNGILFANRIEARREYVEKKSNGLLTYVHIAGMSQPELDRFTQQVFQYAQDKKGLIIDVRNNGGGNTSDRIIDVLERQPNSFYQIRDEAIQMGPGQALAIPMVVMAAETSYSNAEMFPMAMKSRHLATLIGKETPGYVIYTGGGRLVDGTGMRMPGTGVYRLDGSPLEDMGEKMDYDVDITPEEYFSGIDPQLDKSIDVLMGQVKR